jgi:Cyclin, C-terminal domain
MLVPTFIIFAARKSVSLSYTATLYDIRLHCSELLINVLLGSDCCRNWCLKPEFVGTVVYCVCWFYFVFQYLIELSLVNGDIYLQYLPSIIACAAICLARYTLGLQEPWVREAFITVVRILKFFCNISTGLSFRWILRIVIWLRHCLNL